jgi:hypothetical protein
MASIIGFIVGSLGVVWPFKRTIYKMTDTGGFLMDSRNHKIIENYERYLPELNTQTYLAFFYTLVGIAIVLALELYGQKTGRQHA